MTLRSTSHGHAFPALRLILALGSVTLAAGMTGCVAPGYHHSESVAERDESSRIRQALSDDNQYKYDGVNVQMNHGIVRLSGFVSSLDQKQQAAVIAGRIVGIQQVENLISVAPPAN